jgi:uncharacterized protein YjbJ (UPF0337 family)
MDDKLEDLKGRAEEAAVDRARDKTKEILEETKSKIDDAVDALKARLRSGE